MTLSFGPLTPPASASTCTLPMSNGAYLVSSYADIQQIDSCQIIDRDFQLTNSLDLSNQVLEPMPTFLGIFDGGGYSITGINMTVTDGTYAGFWSQVVGAEIRNVTFSGSLSSNVSMTGFLAGALVDTTLEDVIFNIDVSGTAAVGGVASQSIRTFTENVEVNPLDSGSEITGSISTLGGLYSVAMDSTIQFVEVNVEVRGRSNSVSATGGLVGESYSDNSLLWIDVTSNVSSEGSTVGGVIGMTAKGTAPTLLGSSTVTGDVSGSDYVGGLVGRARYLRVSYSLVTGDVEISGLGGGGLFGMWTGETGDIVRTSGFIGSLTSSALNPAVDQEVGGLVGIVSLFFGDDVQIKNTHVNADIKVNTGAAGFIGSVDSVNFNVYLSNSYSSSIFPTSSATARPVIAADSANLVASQVLWDSTKFQGTVGTPVSGALGVSTSALSDMSTFTHVSWDFEEVWKIDENYVAGLPILELIYDYPINDSADISCTLPQNINDAYLVSDADDLAQLHVCDQQEGEQSFLQTNNIELATLTFTPVPEFGGLYDGGGYEINTLMLNFDANQVNGGMFNVLNSAEIKDLTLNGTVTSTHGNTGLLAGKIIGSVITRINLEVGLNAVNTTGGLAGEIENSTISFINVRAFDSNTASIVSREGGGLAGQVTNSGFTDIDVQLDIDATGPQPAWVGGLFAEIFDDVHVDRAKYDGEITGNATFVGGIAGQMAPATTTSSFNQVSSTGNVSGRLFVGGIVGEASNAEITFAYSDMRIEASLQALGGIAGQWSPSGKIDVLSKSFFTGELYDTDLEDGGSAGGLVGLVNGANQLTVSNSGAIAYIQVTYGAGGLFGGIRGASAVVTNSYSSVEFDMPERGENGGNNPVSGSAFSQSLFLLNSYWDSQKYNYTDVMMELPIKSSGYSTANFERFSTGPLDGGWDFSTIWMQDKNVLSGMPILRGLANFPSAPTEPVTCSTLRMPTVWFAANSKKITAGSKSSLNRIVTRVVDSSCNLLSVVGHTSKKETKKGKKATSWQSSLSQKRAMAVWRFLEKGLRQANLQVFALDVAGRGATQLAARETTTKNIAKNRRVTITLS